MAFNILIVDDSATMRGLIRRVLKLTGLELGEVLEAGNGREGLERMRASWVDLVLADLNMPDMAGSEMIEAMKKDPLLANLPVVVVSSSGDQALLDSLMERGVREIVRKPFEPPLMRQIVLRVLGVATEP